MSNKVVRTEETSRLKKHFQKIVGIILKRCRWLKPIPVFVLDREYVIEISLIALNRPCIDAFKRHFLGTKILNKYYAF